MSLFTPGLSISTIYDLDLAALQRRGITLLLADLDNTLVPYGVALPTADVCAWQRKLTQAGITLFILSNNRHPQRAQTFAQAVPCPFLGHAGKPKKGGFQKAMAQMHASPRETAIIGDQIFTDILGGNRAGILTILVRPIRLAGNPGRYLRYAVELPFRWLSRGKKDLS